MKNVLWILKAQNLESEQKHQFSDAKFFVQTIWINISTYTKVNNYLDQGKLEKDFQRWL